MKDKRKGLRIGVDKIWHRPGIMLDNNCPVIGEFKRTVLVIYLLSII